MEEIKDFRKNERMKKRVSEALSAFRPFCVDEAITEKVISSDDTRVLTYSSGEIVFSRESFKKSLCIVIQGSVVIRKESENNSVDMKIIAKNGVFGAAALFGDCDIYASEVKAKGKKTVIVFVSQACVTEIFLEYPGSSIEYIYFLSEKIRYLNERIDCFTGSDAYSKLYKYLKSHPDEEVSAASLSRKLDISRTTLYRCLEKYKEQTSVKD